MKLGAMVLTAAVLCSGLTGLGCSRNRQEAVIKANEADKEKDLNPEGAIAKYDEATKLDPTNHQIFFKMCMVAKKREDWDRAASACGRAAAIAPQFANYWLERGYALIQLAKKAEHSAQPQKYEEAKEPLQKCIEKDPNYADCYEQIAEAYLWTDDEQKALENYSKAIEHDPTRIAFYGPLADLLINLGYMQQAEQVLKEGKTAAKPGDKAVFGIHILLAKVLQDKGNEAEMVTELEAAKAVAPPDGPESVQILWNLGSTYAKLNPPRTQEAIQMLKGFSTRACKGSKAASYKAECEQSQALVTKLGGTMQ